ncbi:hypothetical protein ONS95_000747 [Cadophora gregata]|uniref:uncharacterized protein n=1 Tax=Cadophora gregata TaxID=51156 RepID=UPI0026DB0F39|nr:uncharacterized protein ONS95_000747 [Cadophora gregata]KAK0103075.1 hypothetical protein ONS96_005686 [Cadophora gregata f. sp. sojae]KAK0128797.1 hypothetical protein ONS95_000747 [Cadophora gregata]
MANFDRNSWHKIIVAGSLDADFCFVGGLLGDQNETAGSVFSWNSVPLRDDQQWQIFPYNNTFYVLRTRGSTALGYLGVFFKDMEQTPGKTAPRTRTASLSDDSMFWTIGPWGDGTFWLSNAANGSDWRMTVKLGLVMRR